MKVRREPVASFLAHKPLCHLFYIVLLVACSISGLSEVNVEPLGAFGTVSICRTTRDDGVNVMLHGMNLGNVKVSPNILVDEVVFVLMK